MLDLFVWVYALRCFFVFIYAGCGAYCVCVLVVRCLRLFDLFCEFRWVVLVYCDDFVTFVFVSYSVSCLRGYRCCLILVLWSIVGCLFMFVWLLVYVCLVDYCCLF